jgi:RNA polymerase sigma-70 factor (ECF subfamily)
VWVSDFDHEFTEFFERLEPRLRQALVALCGSADVHDAAADALAYAWQHWPRVRTMANPDGYVYRVARSRVRTRRIRPVFDGPRWDAPTVEPGLPAALARLPHRQRVAVLLVHGWSWTYEESATVMGISVSTLRNHLARGLERLRKELGVVIDG